MEYALESFLTISYFFNIKLNQRQLLCFNSYKIQSISCNYLDEHYCLALVPSDICAYFEKKIGRFFALDFAL